MDDLEGQKYSIKVDESTDCVSEKNLCMLVRYYSKKNQMMLKLPFYH